MKWPWQKQKKIETRSFDVPDKVYIDERNREYSFTEPSSLSRSIEDVLTGYYSNQNFIELFDCLPELFAPVHEIASRVADANWQLIKEWNDEIDYKNEDFNRLFSNPNPMMEFKSMVYQAVCYEILTGKQFFFYNYSDLLAGDDFMNKVITWGNLPAASVTIDSKKGVDPYTANTINDFINLYKVPAGEGRTKTFTPDKITPIFHLDLRKGMDPKKVRPMIRGAEKPLANLIPVYAARGVIYIKRGMMGFIVSRKGDESGMIPLTKKEKQELQDEQQSEYGLRSDKNQVAVASAPVDFVKTSMSIQELEPFEETLADAVAIYACLRVPRHLVPSKDQSTFSNAAADMKAFYADVIIPWAERYAQIFTIGLKTKTIRRYIKADYSNCEHLQENRKDEAVVDNTNGKTMLERFWNGVCSLNDWIVATGGKVVTGNDLYNKKLLEMTPEELEIIKNAVNSRSNVKTDTTSQDSGVQAQK